MDTSEDKSDIPAPTSTDREEEQGMEGVEILELHTDESVLSGPESGQESAQPPSLEPIGEEGKADSVPAPSTSSGILGCPPMPDFGSIYEVLGHLKTVRHLMDAQGSQEGGSARRLQISEQIWLCRDLVEGRPVQRSRAELIRLLRDLPLEDATRRAYKLPSHQECREERDSGARSAFASVDIRYHGRKRRSPTPPSSPDNKVRVQAAAANGTSQPILKEVANDSQPEQQPARRKRSKSRKKGKKTIE